MARVLSPLSQGFYSNPAFNVVTIATWSPQPLCPEHVSPHVDLMLRLVLTFLRGRIFRIFIIFIIFTGKNGFFPTLFGSPGAKSTSRPSIPITGKLQGINGSGTDSSSHGKRRDRHSKPITLVAPKLATIWGKTLHAQGVNVRSSIKIH